jgi:chaperone required for assembly of F1-ATPase
MYSMPTALVCYIGGYAIELDGRTVKTPLRRQLLIPSQPLAAAITAEWDSQQKEIRPSEMHLVGQIFM